MAHNSTLSKLLQFLAVVGRTTSTKSQIINIVSLFVLVFNVAWGLEILLIEFLAGFSLFILLGQFKDAN